MLVNDLAQHVRVELPGVMDLIIDMAFVRTAADFCTRTLVWDKVVSQGPLLSGVREYVVTPPVDARTFLISKAWAGDQELTPRTMEDVTRLMPGWMDLTSERPAYFNAAHNWGSISVFPLPSVASNAALTVRAHFAPSATATTLPDFLTDRFLDALCDGAKARLMAQMNVPWSNPVAAIAFKASYESALLEARITQLHDRVPSARYVAPRSFF